MLRLPAVLLTVALAAGCAAEGDFPSLAPRPIERQLAQADIERPAAAVPDDPSIAERVQGFVAEARRGQAEFEAALPAARAAVGRAGAAGSESWVEAQQAVSRVEAARATITRALAELDAFASAATNGRRLSEADRTRLTGAVADVQAIADRQHRQLVELQERLRPI